MKLYFWDYVLSGFLLIVKFGNSREMNSVAENYDL